MRFPRHTTMPRLSSLLTLSLCIVLIASHAHSADWPGWRGEVSGVSQESAAPLQWGPTDNVHWKAEIPGRGVSSPIVTHDRVYLTTAYEIDAARTLHREIQIFVAIITVLIGLTWGIRSLRHSSPTQVSSGSIIAILACLAAVSLLEFVQSEGPSRLRAVISSLPRLWLASGLIGAIGIAAALQLPGASRFWRTLSAIGAILLTVAYFAFVPEDSLVFPRSSLRPVAWLIALIGVVCGQGSVSRFGKWWWGVASLVPVLVVSFLAYVQWATPNVEDANAEYPGRFWLMTGLLAMGAMFALGRKLSVASPPDTGTATPAPVSTAGQAWLGIASCLVLLGVGAHFYLTNFILPHQGIQRSVICLDAETGGILWEKGFRTTQHERIHRKNSHATPTPVTDGEAVFAYFGDAGLLCLEKDGRERWLNRALPFRDKYGAASSPVLGKGLVFLSCLDLENPSIVAIDQITGQERWRYQLKAEKLVGSYAAPWYGVIQGQEQLVINGARRLFGLNPETGQVLWMHSHHIGEVIPSPVVVDQTIIGGGDRELAIFRLPDDYREIRNPSLLWETNRGAPFHCSTLCHEDQLFSLTDEGVLTCFQIETGKTVWRKRLDGAYTSSPVLVGQHLYLLNRDGATTIVDITQRGEILGTNEIGESGESSLAVSENRLFIRGDRHLYCIGHSEKAQDHGNNRVTLDNKVRKDDLLKAD